MVGNCQNIGLNIYDKFYNFMALNQLAPRITSLKTTRALPPSEMASKTLTKLTNLEHLEMEVLGYDFSPIDLTNYPKLKSLKMSIYFHFGYGVKIQEKFMIYKPDSFKNLEISLFDNDNNELEDLLRVFSQM